MSTKHASTTLTLVETPAETTCAGFCRTHDSIGGVCIGETITLDFTNPGRPDIMATAAHITLAHDAATGTDIEVNIGMGGITLDDADRLADAIKAVVAYARLGGAR